MSDHVIKRNLISRLTAYVLLIPFIPALRPIMGSHSRAELGVFATGFFLTLLLIIISNNRPYIRVSEKNLFIYLMYRHKPEIHSFSSIREVRIHSSGKLELITDGFDPLELRLRKKEREKLESILEKKGISFSKAYRNS